MRKCTLKVFPAGAGREVYRVIEISGDHFLDDLCGAILSAFDFMDEHLYEFCMDNRKYSDYSYRSDPEDDEPSTRVKLDKIGLAVKQKFALHYDFDYRGIYGSEKLSGEAKCVGGYRIRMKFPKHSRDLEL